MQKNTEHILNRDDVGTAILQHLDGLRGIDTHCHHLPDDQFQNMGVKFLYDHSYCNWMDDLLGLLIAIPMSMQISAGCPLSAHRQRNDSCGKRWRSVEAIASSGAVIHGR